MIACDDRNLQELLNHNIKLKTKNIHSPRFSRCHDRDQHITMDLFIGEGCLTKPSIKNIARRYNLTFGRINQIRERELRRVRSKELLRIRIDKLTKE